ncbi:MAG: protein-glutamate O-methyltransferase CheR [Steroidobacteraceae bacterium]
MEAVALTSSSGRMREFAFTDADFEGLRTLVRAATGINLADSKRELVYGRIARRLRALEIDSFKAYRELLADGDAQELVEFCNAITTNLTSFFRESHHFDYLRDHVLKPWVEASSSRRLRIWSAGCSTGEEPYSIAMTIAESVPRWQSRDIRVLATDIDSQVLAHGRAGLYTAERVAGMGARRTAACFEEAQGEARRSYKVRSELAALIAFKQLNLMHELPMPGPIDVIFCRNVVIYFDKDTQRQLFARIARLQRPGQLLFLGHSETLFKVSDDYTLIGKTIYRRN